MRGGGFHQVTVGPNRPHNEYKTFMGRYAGLDSVDGSCTYGLDNIPRRGTKMHDTLLMTMESLSSKNNIPPSEGMPW